MLAEIVVVAVLAVLGTSIFYRFIAERSPQSWIVVRLAKWGCVLAFTSLIGFFFGRPWSLIFPASLFSVSLLIHAAWCYRYGIHPVSAEPRERYLRLLDRRS
jgi:RsiW-degrading membrane proteinase PrsW (M82 family)